MRREFADRLMNGAAATAAAALLVSAGGCQTVGSGRPTAFGQPSGQRLDPRSEAARAALRIDQIEAAVLRLQAQTDGLSGSQQHVVAQAEARLAQSRQETQTLRGELDLLKRDLATLRAEQQQVRRAVDDLPARVSRAVAAVRPATPAVQPSRKPAAGTAVGYEHEVEAGQTLSEIARAYGVRMDAIVRENSLRDAGTIRVGQKLFIPKP